MRSPDSIAFRYGGATTYGELVAEAARLAERITAAVGPGGLVAMDADDGACAARIYLAAAKAGCAVVPLSRESPDEQRCRVLRQARPNALVTAVGDTRGGGRFALSDVADEYGFTAREKNLHDIAYIMFTSGSTGTPKGVVVSHRALAARLAGTARFPGIAEEESILSMTALSFDPSLAEILMPLTVGAAFVVAPPKANVDPSVFAAVLERERPDIVQATPTFWRLALMNRPGAILPRVWTGGEVLSPALAEQLLPRCRELWNLYGPTEGTMWATAARIEDPAKISLGAPIPGSSYLLQEVEDDQVAAGRLVDEPGGQGEILLTGPALAEGYLDRPDLTRRAFQLRGTGPARRPVYRTGDRARLGTDGHLEFLGRLDSQVKIRGHRIELGEVEAALERFPEVIQAAALLREPEAPKAYIEAFIVVSSPVERRDVRAWMRTQLPAVSCPKTVTVVDKLPLTTTGKVDRVLLAAEGW
jgi:amino acid adenylation domain-containing protein